MGGWRWLVLGVALAIGAGAGLGAGAMVWGGDHEDDPAVAAGSAESGHGMAAGAAQGGDAEKGFLAGMIAHHRMAVDMAEQAAGRSEHPEVRRLAGEIVRVQTREIERMRGWYRDWYGQDPPEEPRAGDLALGMGADPAALAASRPFDRAFLAAMIPHHAGRHPRGGPSAGRERPARGAPARSRDHRGPVNGDRPDAGVARALVSAARVGRAAWRSRS